MLEWLGATVWPARNGAEALAIARQKAPDLVFCDLGLPGMDGFALLARLRALPARPPLRIVAVTGFGRDDDVKRTHAAGFDGHLAKPLDFELLAGEVEQVLRHEARRGGPAPRRQPYPGRIGSRGAIGK